MNFHFKVWYVEMFSMRFNPKNLIEFEVLNEEIHL